MSTPDTTIGTAPAETVDGFSFRRALAALGRGDLASVRVLLGIAVIWTIFQIANDRFLSAVNLSNLTLQIAAIATISIGVVLVLLLGEIDLSVGSVSGFAAASMAVLVVDKGYSLFVGILAALLIGLAIGASYAVLYTRLGVPSFVFSLAGLLGFQGALLYVLGANGTINLPADSGLVEFTRQKFLSDAQAYALIAVVVLVYVASQMVGIRRRQRADLTPQSVVLVVVKAVLLAVGLSLLTWYLGIDRGWGYLPLFFAALVVIVDLALRKTRWGRHVFAVGGNEEAARRSGIKVNRIYFSVFALTSVFAAVGGLLAAGQLTSVSQSSGTTDTNLTAIAAAVIGGTSLFGGRGSAYAAMLGIVVLQAIQSGLNIVGVDSSVRFMVTGAVLLLAVAIDSVSRRVRSASGRG